MRGDDQQLQTGMFSYVALEERIPADHPPRGVRKLVDTVLARMMKEFDGLYSEVAATDSAGAVAAGTAAAGVLFGAQRAAAMELLKRTSRHPGYSVSLSKR